MRKKYKNYKIIDGTFIKNTKIDNRYIDLEYNNTSIIKIWYTYNGWQQSSIMYDLKNKNFIAGNIDAIFTSRQKKILIKKMNDFSKNIILHHINIINNNHFTLTDYDIEFIENLKNKLAII